MQHEVKPHGGAEYAWADGIGGDVISGGLICQRLRETDHGKLGSAVRRHPGSPSFAGDRCGVDDAAPAPLDHAWQDRLAAQKDAFDVDVHHGVPLVFGGFDNRPGVDHAGVVAKDVDGTKLLCNGVHHRFQLGQIRNVHGHADGSPAVGLQVLNGL